MDRLGSQALDTGRLINLEEPLNYIGPSVHHIGWSQGCLPYEFLIQSESDNLGISILQMLSILTLLFPLFL